MVKRQIHASQLSGLVPVLGLFLALAPGLFSAADHETAKRLYTEANSFLDQCRFVEAVAAYDRTLSEDPTYVEAIYNRALASEMVDRNQALTGWQRFLDAANGRQEFKWDVARVNARIQILRNKPSLPEAMQPGRYVTAAGDYYREIGPASDGEQWSEFPVKVFLGSAPNVKWQQGAREAFDIWNAVFPMQLVGTPEKADIRIGWDESMEEGDQVGQEADWVRIKRVGNQLNGRRVAVITIDLSRPWSKDEMRAMILHEFGHALGIKGHSDRKKDIMHEEIQEKSRQLRAPSGAPLPIFWKSLVSQPSQRDMNTLIRLYKSPGSISRFD